MISPLFHLSLAWHLCWNTMTNTLDPRLGTTGCGLAHPLSGRWKQPSSVQTCSRDSAPGNPHKANSIPDLSQHPEEGAQGLFVFTSFPACSFIVWEVGWGMGGDDGEGRKGVGRNAYLLAWGLQSGSRSDALEEPGDDMSCSVFCGMILRTRWTPAPGCLRQPLQQVQTKGLLSTRLLSSWFWSLVASRYSYFPHFLGSILVLLVSWTPSNAE